MRYTFKPAPGKGLVCRNDENKTDGGEIERAIVVTNRNFVGLIQAIDNQHMSPVSAYGPEYSYPPDFFSTTFSLI
jgi:hypothetical protein